MQHLPSRIWAPKGLVLLLVGMMIAGGAGRTRAQLADAGDDPVEKALRKAVQYLYSVQQKDGAWEPPPLAAGAGHGQYGGISAMAVYGLLAAGERPTNPKLQLGMQFMDQADVTGTYAMGMKLQTWNYVPSLNERQRKVLMKDATLLMGGANLPAGPSQGLYHYNVKADGTNDISCSNYGVLGMWAAGQQNLEIPEAFWKLLDTAWRRVQNKDGGWQYGGGGPNGAMSTLAMTAAGVATLFVIQDMLLAGKAAQCKGNIFDKDIERGLAWLAKNYTGGGGNLYAMYNVERVGTASGYKYFGTVDWYKEGSQALLKSQAANGSWGAVPQTAWAIMFLVKGRAPVMMNKLEYDIDTAGDKAKIANWNQRPRDVANLARWAGKQLEKELNWQIVNLNVDIEDLHDSPILFLSGNQAMNFSKDEKAKLKTFVEGGGLILGNADCQDGKFSGSFIKLGQELFPAYEFRELPSDHLIYSTQYNIKTTNRSFVKGISNGAREMMIVLSGGDPAAFWQIRNFSSTQAKAMSELVTNIYLYALDKRALATSFKGKGYIVKRDKSVAKTTAKLARLEYGGNWNPEPGGWRRFANVLHNTRGVDLTVEPVKLGEGKLGKDYKIAHLTGTAKFKLTDPQRKEVTDFVNGGGTLIVDAAGGSTEFKDAADTELAAMFPEGAAKLGSPLPATHGIYAAGGDKVAQATYRDFARKLLVSNMSAPRIRGIEINGRTGVIYSQEDLSVGLVGMTFEGINGYEPRYATELMSSITMHILGGGAPKIAATNPTTGPTTKPVAAAAAAPVEKKPEPAAPAPAKVEGK